MERSFAGAPQEAVAASMSHNPSLTGLTRAGLAEALRAIETPDREIRMRVAQLWHWIYFHGVREFDAMLNVSKVMRVKLAQHYTLARPEVVEEQISTDGTRKWLIRMAPVDALDKGAEVECVYIPESDRGTLCVSSQVGWTSTARSATPARKGWCATSPPPKSSPNSSSPAKDWAIFRAVAPRRHRSDSLRRGRARRLQHRVHGDGRAALQF